MDLSPVLHHAHTPCVTRSGFSIIQATASRGGVACLPHPNIPQPQHPRSSQSNEIQCDDEHRKCLQGPAITEVLEPYRLGRSS